MSGHPGSGKPDLGVVLPPTPDQRGDARSYIARQRFDDEGEILDMLGLDGAA